MSIHKIYIYFFLLISIECVIKLKFKTSYINEELLSTLKEDEFYNEFFQNNLYIEIEMGTPKKILPAFISYENHVFYITDDGCDRLKKIIEKDSVYNPIKSSTFIKESESNLNFDDEFSGYKIKETLYLNDNDNKIIKIDSFPLFLALTDKDNNNNFICGKLGLQMKITQEFFLINFIEKLKNINKINSYTWTLKYTSEYEGYVYIGDEPHDYENKNYHESQLRRVNTGYVINLITDDRDMRWSIEFSSISSGEQNLKESRLANINHSSNRIFGNKEYYNLIKDQFFYEYIEKEICRDLNIRVSFHIIYCDADKFTEDDMKQIPMLNFYHNSFFANFSLDYKELFTKIGNKYYFNIIFSMYNNNWVLGKLFLKKYQLTFNQDTKLIGYYNNDLPIIESKTKPNKRNYPFLIFLIIILSVVLLIIGIYIAKKIYNKNRKAHINELDDDFEYKNQENKNNTLMEQTLEMQTSNKPNKK